MPLTKEEVNRKLLHILSGTMIPAGIFYFPMIEGSNKWVPVIILAALAAGSVLLEYLRFNNKVIQKLFMSLGSSMLRSHEDRSVTGATYIFLSALICSIVFICTPSISFMVISLFILGDAIAAIVGISIGRIKIGKKSLEGSVACFVLGLIMFFFVFPHVPLLLKSWGGKVPLPLIFIASFLNTIFELFPIKLGKMEINDNLSVPVINGLAMLAWFKYLT